jgi:trehalose 6-phosphate synthase
VPERPVVIVSNRGPLSFRRDDNGRLIARRGAGGLVSGLAPLVAGTDAVWLAAPISDGDREAAAGGEVAEADGLRVRLLSIDETAYRMSYDVICNATLWFCVHGLYDLPRRPRIDRRWREAWEAYREVNEAFALAAAEIAPQNAVVLVQDYHVALVGAALRAARPDVATVHFTHTPWCEPDGLRPLPADAARELVNGIAANSASTFHTHRWADAFSASHRTFMGEAAPPRVGVTPLASDPEDLAATATSAECEQQRLLLDESIGDRKLLVRVDRIELSKNILRGFHAFDELLTMHPEWRERVVFGALLYPSREGLPEYLAYRQEVEGLVERLNAKWATPTWTPIMYDASDDFPRSIASLQRADVVLVNPIRDGLNLVAKEAVLLGDAVLVLSTEAGVYEEIGDAGVIAVNPFDVGATADAMHQALAMDASERKRRHDQLHAVVVTRTPRDWLQEQLDFARD